MYNIDNADVVNTIESHCRTWRIWLENVSTGEIFSGDTIMNANSQHDSTSLSDDIELGAICSASWQIEIADISRKFLGEQFRLYFYLKDFLHPTTWGDLKGITWGELRKYSVSQISDLGAILNGELFPMGVFTCVKSKKSGDKTNLTLYDRLYFSDEVYVPKISLPNSSSYVEIDICHQLKLPINEHDWNNGVYGLRDTKKTGGQVHNRVLKDSSGKILNAQEFDFTIDKIPEPGKTTMRQMLSYIAACHGQFGYVDRNGEYQRKWYSGTADMEITADRIDEPTISEQENKIVGITCKSGDNTFSIGDISGKIGRVISFENPYMTQSLFNSLANRLVKISSFKWHTADVFMRLGDPRIDIGDMLKYGQKLIPVTKLGFNFDGGLSADISAVGRSVEESL